MGQSYRPTQVDWRGGLTYGIPYKGDQRIQVSHRFGALQYTRLVMLAASERTIIMALTVIFAVAHLGFVAWSIPFGFERCAAPVRSPMLVLMSAAPVPSDENEVDRGRGTGIQSAQSVGLIRNIDFEFAGKGSTVTCRGEETWR